MLATKRKLSHVTKGSIFDDRDLFTPEESAVLKVKSALLDAIQQEVDRKRYTPVSYTHLTLPTIYSV